MKSESRVSLGRTRIGPLVVPAILTALGAFLYGCGREAENGCGLPHEDPIVDKMLLELLELTVSDSDKGASLKPSPPTEDMDASVPKVWWASPHHGPPERYVRGHNAFSIAIAWWGGNWDQPYPGMFLFSPARRKMVSREIHVGYVVAAIGQRDFNAVVRAVRDTVGVLLPGLYAPGVDAEQWGEYFIEFDFNGTAEYARLGCDKRTIDILREVKKAMRDGPKEAREGIDVIMFRVSTDLR